MAGFSQQAQEWYNVLEKEKMKLGIAGVPAGMTESIHTFFAPSKTRCLQPLVAVLIYLGGQMDNRFAS